MADSRVPASERVTSSGSGTTSVANRSNAMAFNTSNLDTGNGAVFVENPLSKVSQPSYHWKFGVGDDIGDSTDMVVILAETGLTSFNITNVEIDAVVGPNSQSQNTQYSVFTITIIEPLGMQLQDKFIAASTYVGINNLLKCPYLISLRFQGYDDDGSPIDPVGQTWTWKLNILTFEATLDPSGAKYVITAVPMNEMGHSNDVELIRSTIELDVSKKEGKVGDVMASLQKEINASIEKSYNVAGGGIAPFKVVIDDRPYKNTVKGASRPFDHKIIRDQKHLVGQNKQGVMSISKGTDISKIIDYLMSASETATAMINPNESATENDAETKEFSSAHRIEIRITNTGYNTKTQDYIRTITYTIVAHDSVRPILSPKGQDDAKINGPKKLNFIKSNNLMKKQYQYLFTGKNTEVLDFNINLNFQFAAVQNALEGYISTENARVGRQFDPDNFNKQTMNQKWSQVSPGITPISYCKAPLDIASGTPTDELELLASFGKKQTILAESLSNYSSYWPTTIIQTGQGTTYNVNQQVEANNLRSRSIYAAVINQLYGQTADLMTVDLEIRGDPYWLGVANIEDFMTPPSEDKASYALGEHCFFLRFIVPQGIDDDGAPILSPSNAYSGYYTAQKIRHKFNNGVFTQSVTGIRIPLIDVLQSN